MSNFTKFNYIFFLKNILQEKHSKNPPKRQIPSSHRTSPLLPSRIVSPPRLASKISSS